MITKEQWEMLEDNFNSRFTSSKVLKCDEYEILISLERVKPLQYQIVVYVKCEDEEDYSIKGKYGAPDSPVGQKFYRPVSRNVYSKKEILETQKVCGKRFANKLKGEKIHYHTPGWNSFKTLKKHLLKTCENIELLSV